MYFPRNTFPYVRSPLAPEIFMCVCIRGFYNGFSLTSQFVKKKKKRVGMDIGGQLNISFTSDRPRFNSQLSFLEPV
jgi:hypothetical protein